MRKTAKMDKIYLGFDPGKSGGIACIRVNGNKVFDVPTAKVWDMPKTEEELWEWFSYRREYPLPPFSQNVYAAVEKVSGYIGEEHPGSSMFNFGKSYGSLLMALIAAGIPKERRISILPQVWQRGLGIPPRKKSGIGVETDSKFKNRLKAKAMSLFPNVKVTLKTCDALLIAEYARRRFENATDEGAKETLDRMFGSFINVKLNYVKDGEISSLLEKAHATEEE